MTHRQNHAPLLLIELMISIFLFAASAVALVQIFAAADKISTRARNRSQAATMLQTAAGAYFAADGDPTQTAALLGKVWDSPEAVSAGGQTSGETLTFYFDEDWNSTGSSDSAAFLLVIRFQPDKEKPQPGSAAVTISDTDGDELLTQTVTQYEATRTEVSP